MKNKLYQSMPILAALILIATGCDREAPMEKMIPVDTGREITAAIAVLHPTEGNTAMGTVTFTKVEDGIRIVADVEGLIP